MRWLEFSSGLSAVLFGIWISTPALTRGSGPAASWMLNWMARETWAALFVAGGVLQLLALVRGGKRARVFTSMCALMTWAFLTIGAFLNLGTLTPLTLVTALCMALTVISLVISRAE